MMKISKVNLDIHARKPVNLQAAKVFFGGINYDPKKKLNNLHSEIPLPTRLISYLEKNNPSFVDLHGVKQGRLTVVGISAVGKGVWIVRCACGIYTYRRAKALKNDRNNHDCCDYCRHTEYLKRNSTLRHCGKYID